MSVDGDERGRWLRMGKAYVPSLMRATTAETFCEKSRLKSKLEKLFVSQKTKTKYVTKFKFLSSDFK